jgi:hypothetical protein
MLADATIAWMLADAHRGIGQLPTEADFVMLFNNTPNHPEYPAGHVTTGRWTLGHS